MFVGFGAGYYVSNTYYGGQRFLGHMFASAGYSSLALLEYQEGDTDYARAAVLGFVDFASHLKTFHEGQPDKAVQGDIANSYFRLAVLETRVGNTAAAEQDILLEEQTFQSAGKKVSRDDIRKWVSKAARQPSVKINSRLSKKERPALLHAGRSG